MRGPETTGGHRPLELHHSRERAAMAEETPAEYWTCLRKTDVEKLCGCSKIRWFTRCGQTSEVATRPGHVVIGSRDRLNPDTNAVLKRRFKFQISIHFNKCTAITRYNVTHDES